MKGYLTSLVEREKDPIRALNLVREYLQARILQGVQGAQGMLSLAFHGGTCLRFLFSLPRFSEDLDFAVERPERGYDFRDLIRSVTRDFQREDYRLDVRVSDNKTVHSAFLRFRGLAYELGLPAQRSQVLAIKVEVDTRPPAGAGLSLHVVRRHVALNLQHHDRATLFSGKLHAVLQRAYPKGRDYYDLLWYLTSTDWPEPNLEHLNQALRQTGWTGGTVTPDNWRSRVAARVRSLDWGRIRSDVTPFLENPPEADLLREDTLLSLLGE
ncbi:MAG: nucleotidyl transferase AbiEii/AbiGii toxin family protein [Armatimonadetes bacterium]|nr:nucleotidyl transferase AbiEii/AbiGii toxin family protein [Armatimonadota bacterium]